MTERYLRFSCEHWEHCCYSYTEFKQNSLFFFCESVEIKLFCHRCFQVIIATSANPTLTLPYVLEKQMKVRLIIFLCVFLLQKHMKKMS